MMKSICCLLFLGSLLIVSAEECFDQDAVMKEYNAHKDDCEKLCNKDDQEEMVGCLLGRYECTDADGKVDMEKFRTKALGYITLSENKKTIMAGEIDRCEKENADDAGKHKLFHCVGEAFKKNAQSRSSTEDSLSAYSV